MGVLNLAPIKANGWNPRGPPGGVKGVEGVEVGVERDESWAVNRFFGYSTFPGAPLLEFGDKQAGLMRFSFCRLE